MSILPPVNATTLIHLHHAPFALYLGEIHPPTHTYAHCTTYGTTYCLYTNTEWSQFTGGNECTYKHVAAPLSWFNAVRHCHENEDHSELATVLSKAESQFVAEVAGVDSSTPRWVYGFNDEGAWNVDFAANNLWQPGQPGNFKDEVKLCVMQDGGPLLKAEACSVHLPFVCKRCPTIAAAIHVVHTRQLIVEKPLEILAPAAAKQLHNKRARRADATTTTTTPAPVQHRGGNADLHHDGDATTTTTTGAPERAGAGNLEAGSTTTTTTAEPQQRDTESTAQSDTVEEKGTNAFGVAGAGSDVDVEFEGISPAAGGASATVIAAVVAAAVVIVAAIAAAYTSAQSPRPTQDANLCQAERRASQRSNVMEAREVDATSAASSSALALDWDDSMC